MLSHGTLRQNTPKALHITAQGQRSATLGDEVMVNDKPLGIVASATTLKGLHLPECSSVWFAEVGPTVVEPFQGSSELIGRWVSWAVTLPRVVGQLWALL